jgi:hypothetical protein
MSHGPGRLQRDILDYMRKLAVHQRSPERRHFRVEDLVL